MLTQYNEYDCVKCNQLVFPKMGISWALLLAKHGHSIGWMLNLDIRLTNYTWNHAKCNKHNDKQIVSANIYTNFVSIHLN